MNIDIGPLDVKIILTQNKKKHTVTLDRDGYKLFLSCKWSIYKHRNTFYLFRIELINGKYKNLKFHRELLKLKDKSLLVDHINRDGLDNRLVNLRLCSNRENCRNRNKRKNTSSVFKGVHFEKRSNKWLARIQTDNKRITLGLFDNEYEAAKAYDLGALKYFGEFACTNKSMGLGL